MTDPYRAMCAELLEALEIQLDELRFNNRLCIRARALLAQPMAEAPAEALAARPLLEQVAAMADCIGAHTVGQIPAISDRAAAWLRENPPGQPVAIEPRGCPLPGACSCVEPAAPKPPTLKEQALKALTAINSNFHVDEPDASIIRRALEALDD